MVRYFETDDEADFQYVLGTTGLQECILAAWLARSGHKVLNIDKSDSYGGQESSLSFVRFKSFIHENRLDHTELVDIAGEDNSHFLSATERQFSIDVSVPKMLFCNSKSVDFLVEQQVSKYISFLPVQKLRVGDWEFPVSRGKVFADKFLKLPEKRALMELLKSAVASSSAVHSTAMVAKEQDTPKSVAVEGLAVEYLKKEYHIERSELVQAIVHGMCLYPFSPNSMTARELLSSLSRFVASLTSYADGCPLLVPMYGNSDLPQAFARAAAVEGALYILDCALEKIRPELPASSQFVTMSATGSATCSVLHGVVCLEEIDHCVSLTILSGADDTDSSSPIFVLALPNLGGGVCPPGCVLFHFVQIKSLAPLSESPFDETIQKFVLGRKCRFALRYRHGASGSNLFDIDASIESARTQFNLLSGLAPDTPCPIPKDKASTVYSDSLE